MTASRLSAGVVVSLLTLHLIACTENQSSPRAHTSGAKSATPILQTSPSHRIIETFDVGQGVYVRALAVDPRTNNLWVGTSVGALEVDTATGNMRATYTRENALANEYVFAIMSARDGSTWFGTNGGGASRLRDDQWQTYFPMHGLADYWVYSFTQQASGTVWIGTWAGLNAFDPVTGRFKTYLQELVNEWVYGLDVDSRDHVWIGTEGGVNMFDGHSWHTWTHADGLGAPNDQNLPFSPNTGLGTRSRHDLSVMVDGQATYNPNYVFDILVAGDDSVWAGTWGGGVSRYDGQRWRNFTRKDGLAGNIVYALAEDQNGGLWFGTDQGLGYYDGSNWEVISGGLPDAHVYAVAAGPAGHIWAGTRGGVAHIVRRRQ